MGSLLSLRCATFSMLSVIGCGGVAPSSNTADLRASSVSRQVFVRAGQYTIGCDDASMCSGNPKRSVSVVSYQIDRYQVLDLDYTHCESLEKCPRHYYFYFSREKDADEVALVTADGALAYCRWRHGHLPSQLEWEVAARGTKATLFPWGNTWTIRDTARLGTQRRYDLAKRYPKAGTRPDLRSEFGTEDMSGNAPEFVQGENEIQTRGSPSLDPYKRIHATAADYSLVKIHPVQADDTAAFRCAY